MLDTLSNVKSRLGITESTYDTFLTQQITMLSDTIEAYCRRRFLSDEYEQTFYRNDCKPSQIMELFHYPATLITSIEEDGEVLDSSEYRLNKPQGKVIRESGTFFWAKETVVVYTAGLASTPTPVLAVLDSLVQERYNKKKSGVDLNFGSDVQRVSIPGAISIDFDYSLSNNDRKTPFGIILGSNTNVLDNYRSDRAIVGSNKIIYVEEA